MGLFVLSGCGASTGLNTDAPREGAGRESSDTGSGDARDPRDSGDPEDGSRTPDASGSHACPNGIVDPGEECDDGNADDGDACTSSCRHAFCGDGILRRGVEQCDLGPDNADIPAWAVRQGDTELAVRPIWDDSDAILYYGYWQNDNAHTGYEAPRRALMFIHQTWVDEGNSLIYVFSEEDAGIEGWAEIDFDGLATSNAVLFSDDPRAPAELSSTGEGRAHGSHHFRSATDGGIVALACPGVATITLELSDAIEELVWVEPLAYPDMWPREGRLTQLDPSTPIEVECNAEPSACGTDCEIPACGDGFQDPGEDCDAGDSGPADDRCRGDCWLP